MFKFVKVQFEYVLYSALIALSRKINKHVFRWDWKYIQCKKKIQRYSANKTEPRHLA